MPYTWNDLIEIETDLDPKPSAEEITMITSWLDFIENVKTIDPEGKEIELGQELLKGIQDSKIKYGIKDKIKIFPISSDYGITYSFVAPANKDRVEAFSEDYIKKAYGNKYGKEPVGFILFDTNYLQYRYLANNGKNFPTGIETLFHELCHAAGFSGEYEMMLKPFSKINDAELTKIETLTINNHESIFNNAIGKPSRNTKSWSSEETMVDIDKTALVSKQISTEDLKKINDSLLGLKRVIHHKNDINISDNERTTATNLYRNINDNMMITADIAEPLSRLATLVKQENDCIEKPEFLDIMGRITSFMPNESMKNNINKVVKR